MLNPYSSAVKAAVHLTAWRAFAKFIEIMDFDGGKMSILAVDPDKCNFCGLCAMECPAAIIVIKGPEALPFMPRGGEKFCINCGHCVAVCPPGAISLETMKPADCTTVSNELLPTPEQVEHFLKSRRSVRVFKKEPVPRTILAKLIDIARYAPSGRNAQPVQWLVVENPNEVKRLSEKG